MASASAFYGTHGYAMNMLCKYLLAFLFLAFLAAPAGAQQAAVVVPPGVYKISAPIVLCDLPQGAIYDASAATIVAAAPMDALVTVCSQNENLYVTLKFGVLDANHLATTALYVTATNDSRIEVAAIQNATVNGVVIDQTGDVGVFNNFIELGAIRFDTHNGLVLLSPPSGVLGVQGNHIRVGQVFENGDSGIAVFGVSSYNYLEVGPVEHNTLYGCYDGAGGNNWLIVNANSNGFKGAC